MCGEGVEGVAMAVNVGLPALWRGEVACARVVGGVVRCVHGSLAHQGDLVWALRIRPQVPQVAFALKRGGRFMPAQ